MSGRAGALAIVGVLAVGLLFDAAATPGPKPTTDRIDANADCVTCHADVAAEWAASGHGSAHDDPIFQAALARESQAWFCVGCHAPEADPRRPPSERAGAIGVACVSCHLADDDVTVLAGPGSAIAPHPLRREPSFASADACASCHEFGFPDARADPNLLMQQTISEHQASDAADRPCQDCHMPPAAGEQVHRSHRFAVDDALLAAAARYEVTRDGDTVVVSIEPRALGHAFPTGDLFRRLVVEVAGLDGSWAQRRFLARRFDLLVVDGARIKVEVADDRVGARHGPTRVTFELPASVAEQPLRWSVTYERVLDSPIGSSDQAEVWDRRELASGELPRP